MHSFAERRVPACVLRLPEQAVPSLSRGMSLARFAGGLQRCMAQRHGAHAGACEALASGINKTCGHCFTRKREHGLTGKVCFVRTQGSLERQGLNRRALGGSGVERRILGFQGFNVECLRGPGFKRGIRVNPASFEQSVLLLLSGKSSQWLMVGLAIVGYILTCFTVIPNTLFNCSASVVSAGLPLRLGFCLAVMILLLRLSFCLILGASVWLALVKGH